MFHEYSYVCLGLLTNQVLRCHRPLQVSSYLPSYLPADQVFQPDAPKPEDVAVLLEGDEDIDIDTLRKKGKCPMRGGGPYWLLHN